MAWTDFKRDACLIGGEWVAATGPVIDVTDPATGAHLGAVPRFGREETARAVDAAHDAFLLWKEKTGAERAAIMMKIHDALLDCQDDLGELLTREQGKPLAEGRGEVGISAAYIRWFAEEARRIYGDTIPSPWADRRIMVIKQPVGVVGAVTPWNFPSSMIARKLGAALAAGCTMVCKPASLTPYSTLAFAQVAEEAGLPKGVVNVVTGSAGAIADEMCENPKVKKITFTGSTPVGKQLAANAMKSMKKISMELGGNAPFIVFDDADIERAIAGVMPSKFRNSGQTCVCANRILVQDGIYDAFVARFAEEVGKLRVGVGTEAGVTTGPLVDAKAAASVKAFVDDAVAKGATLRAGGGDHPLGGCFLEPTILENITDDMRVAREEIFGPVAPVIRFSTEEEAVAKANDTEYGLACYFFTKDLSRAYRVMEALDYGQVGVNEGLITTEVAPFGGVKESGMGKEGSKYGCDDYLTVKYCCVGI